jgi:hypothetical protein
MFNYKITATLIVYFTILLCACGQLSKHKNLKEISAEFNKQCPSMRDSETRLDKTSVLSNNFFELTFTLVHLEKENIDVNGLEKELKKFLIDYLKNSFKKDKTDNNYLESLKNNNVTFKYIYLDNKGQQLTQLFIRPIDYK